MKRATTDADERIYKAIASSVEQSVKEVASWSLDYGPAVVRSIKPDKDELLISISVPFLLPPPSSERYDLKRRRDKFATYVMKTENQRRLSHLLYEILVESVVEPDKRQRWNKSILKRLKGVAQRALAGRLAKPIPTGIRDVVAAEGKSVWKIISNIQRHIKRWKAMQRLDDLTLKLKLQKAFPSKKFPWIQDFLGLDGKIPRRRNLYNLDFKSDFAESADPEARSVPCKHSEPEYWSLLDLTVKVMQRKLHRETRVNYPLRQIKALIK